MKNGCVRDFLAEMKKGEKMQKLMKEQAILIFDTYNRALSEVYESILGDVEQESELASADFQEYLQSRVLNALHPWYSMPLEGLQDETPEGFFDSILSMEDALEIFDIAAEKVDGDLPDPFLLRLAAFGETVSDALLEKAFSHDWEKPSDMDEMDFHDLLAIDIAALRVLGLWKEVDSINPILDRFLNLASPIEYLADGIKAYVQCFEEQIVPDLIARLSNPVDSELGGGYEYALVFLTEVGKYKPEEEIFQCLRASFRAMKNKVIAAICLGDYGDGRAVPLLKSYIDRHLNEIDQPFFYETLSAIKRLGGEIGDIQDPFRK